MIYTESNANFSEDMCYRYQLFRRWSDGEIMVVIGLNPSIAGETDDDPTIIRCRNFAAMYGYGALRMLNLFAWIETQSQKLPIVADPIGPENGQYLSVYTIDAGVVVAAWGALPGAKLWRTVAIRRANGVARRLRDSGINLHAFALTREGYPKHPLYLPGNTTLIDFP